MAPTPRMDNVEFSTVWQRSSSAEEVLPHTPYTTVSQAQSKASYIRGKGGALKYLPNKKGGVARIPQDKKSIKKEDKKEEARISNPTNPEAIYAAGVFDTSYTLEAYLKINKQPALRCRITTTRLCAIERVQKWFGGEIKSLNGSHQLSWDGETTYDFLRAIMPYSACEHDQMQVAQQFLEAEYDYKTAGEELVKVFKIE